MRPKQITFKQVIIFFSTIFLFIACAKDAEDCKTQISEETTRNIEVTLNEFAQDPENIQACENFANAYGKALEEYANLLDCLSDVNHPRYKDLDNAAREIRNSLDDLDCNN